MHLDRPPSKAFLYLMSFCEGGALLAAEILGAKMLAPYFGSSIYVWAAVLSATLGGLALGYFVGGNLARGPRRISALMWAFTGSGLAFMAMPLLARGCFSFFDAVPLLPALLACSFLLLAPLMCAFGCISPLIIGGLTRGEESAGRIAGLVFATNTLGGIFSALLTGFWMIPQFGVSRPAYFCGAAMVLIGLFGFRQRRVPRLAILALLLAALGKFNQKKLSDKVLYYSEGLAGQILVALHPLITSDGPAGVSRSLFINRWEEGSETSENLPGALKYQQILFDMTMQSDAKSVLLGGLGSGWLGKNLHAKGIKVEVAEIDPRIPQIARRFFNLPNEVAVYEEDFRRYLRMTNKKYDAIVIDLFSGGEEVPFHCVSREAFVEMREHLAPGGIILMNFYGYWDAPLGLGARVVGKTMQEAGFEVERHLSGEPPVFANQVFAAAVRLGETGIPRGQPIHLAELASVPVTTDDHPLFEIFNSEGTLQTRADAIEYFKHNEETDWPFFF